MTAMSLDSNPSLAERIARLQAAAAARQQASTAAVATAAPVALAPMPSTPAPTAAQQSIPVDMPVKPMKRQQRLLWDIVRAAQLNGANDLTNNEIRERWERQSGQRQRDGTVSGRVTELMDNGWLLRRDIRRTCTDSGHLAWAVYVPPGLLHVDPDRVAGGAAR